MSGTYIQKRRKKFGVRYLIKGEQEHAKRKYASIMFSSLMFLRWLCINVIIIKGNYDPQCFKMIVHSCKHD